MTSVGVKIDNSMTRQSGPYYFKIQGKLHHLTGALLSVRRIESSNYSGDK